MYFNTLPAFKDLGLLIPFNLLRTAVVVPSFLAITDKLSPLRTL
jgi:hypothetical protein